MNLTKIRKIIIALITVCVGAIFCFIIEFSYRWGDKDILLYDTFDNCSLNDSLWEVKIGPKYANGELEFYQQENIEVKDGMLIITAKEQQVDLYPYTSGCIMSRDVYDTENVCVEVRMKVPMQQGAWPAVWMMGIGDTWPKCGEIDIVEQVNKSNEVFGTTHWYSDKQESFSGKGYVDNMNDFHVYRFEKKGGQYKWYIDDEIYYSHILLNRQQSSELNSPMNLIINLAVGSWFFGEPDETTKFPFSMYVDYIKVSKISADK